MRSIDEIGLPKPPDGHCWNVSRPEGRLYDEGYLALVRRSWFINHEVVGMFVVPLSEDTLATSARNLLARLERERERGRLVGSYK